MADTAKADKHHNLVLRRHLDKLEGLVMDLIRPLIEDGYESGYMTAELREWYQRLENLLDVDRDNLECLFGVDLDLDEDDDD